jgi:hypothetical protein
MKKGVYVDNLTEHSVVTVNDVLRLLEQVGFCGQIYLQFELTFIFYASVLEACSCLAMMLFSYKI